MKSSMILNILTIVAMVGADHKETYDTKYNIFNAKELVEHVRLLRGHGKCFLSNGPCTPEGTELKKIIPDAMKTQCAKCTAKQLQLIRLVVHGFQEKLPEMWAEIHKTYDPGNKYNEQFDNFIYNVPK
ncbi:hypothetical protein ACJJTC_003087 [Scirpophaga incertulas]